MTTKYADLCKPSAIQLEALKHPCPACKTGTLHEVPDPEASYEVYLWCNNCPLSMDTDGGYIN